MRRFFLNYQHTSILNNLREMSLPHQALACDGIFNVRSQLRNSDYLLKSFNLKTSSPLNYVKSFFPFTKAYKRRLKCAESLEQTRKILKDVKSIKAIIPGELDPKITQRLMKNIQESQEIFPIIYPNPVGINHLQQQRLRSRSRSRSPSPEAPLLRGHERTAPEKRVKENNKGLYGIYR